MFLGVHKTYGWVSGLSLMLYVSEKYLRKSVNSDGYFVEFLIQPQQAGWVL